MSKKKKTTTIFIELKYDETEFLELEPVLEPVMHMIHDIPKQIDHTVSVKTESKYDW